MLWEGRPPTGIRFCLRDLAFLAALAVLISLYIGSRTGKVSQPTGQNAPFPLLIAAWCSAWGVYRFLIDPGIRRQIRFVLTEERFIVEGRFLRTTVRTLELNRMRDIMLWRHADDHGTLIVSAPKTGSDRRPGRIADTILDATLWAAGNGRYDDLVVAIEVERGVKALHQLFVAAIQRARGNDANPER